MNVRAAAGYPLPPSPERLIRTARLMDGVWRQLEAAGVCRPTLEEELDLWARLRDEEIGS